MHSCSHCQNQFNLHSLKRIEMDGEVLYFCCNGCELAYSLLKENNLQSFYDKIGSKKLNTQQLKEHKNDVNYDSISFKEQYIKELDDGLKEVRFFINGIVCAACVWLNERIISTLNGVIEINVNYTNYKARIIFDDNIISFAEIVKKINDIGYNITVIKENEKSQSVNRIYYTKLVVAIFCTMNVMWVNVGQYLGFFSGIDIASKNILNLASFLLSTPVLFFCASEFYKNAYFGLKNKIVGMDLLVTTGTTIVYIYSIYAWLVSKNETYFESVSMIITFILSAKFVENIVRKSADDNLNKLNSILPLEARMLDGAIKSVNDIKIDDELLVLPGEMIACDGILLSKNAMLDSSNINGESLEIEKHQNDEILAGCICLNYAITYKAKALFKNSSISKLVQLLQDSSFSPPKIATLAFKISSVFSKCVLGIAFVGFLFHLLSGSTFSQALLIAISVIVIACPCALALATPISSIVGLNRAFKNHIVFRTAQFLETLANVDTIIFDKTGTLTNGILMVKNHIVYNDSIINNDILGKINALNPHRISSAIKNYLDEQKAHLNDLQDLSHIENQNMRIANGTNAEDKYIKKDLNIALDSNILESNLQDDNVKCQVLQFNLIDGCGFRAIVKIEDMEYEVLGGNKELFKDTTLPDMNDGNDEIIFFLGYRNLKECDIILASVFYFTDSIKNDAKSVISSLQKMKKDVLILSGDRCSVVESVASTLGIEKFYHSHTPLQKADFIKNLQTKEGKKVVMIGDGLNDSLALNYAHVGIVMGSGSQISISHSDVVILDDSLTTLLKAFKISNLTLQSIKQNLLMSVIYNCLAIPFALCGFIIPLFAAIFMSLSSISVLLNSMRQNLLKI